MATAQVADLLRQADVPTTPWPSTRKAVELATQQPPVSRVSRRISSIPSNGPTKPKPRWAKIADGPNKNAKNLARLAEVLAGFGYLKEAAHSTDRSRFKLDADDFGLRLKLAEYDHRLERYDDAEIQLTAAAKLAEKDEEKAGVLEARVKNDQGAGRLAARIETLRKALEGDKDATAERWEVLARYLEADTKLPEAVRATDQAIALDPRSIRAWTLAARVRESAGNLETPPTPCGGWPRSTVATGPSI